MPELVERTELTEVLGKTAHFAVKYKPGDEDVFETVLGELSRFLSNENDVDRSTIKRMLRENGALMETLDATLASGSDEELPVPFGGRTYKLVIEAIDSSEEFRCALVSN